MNSLFDEEVQKYIQRVKDSLFDQEKIKLTFLEGWKIFQNGLAQIVLIVERQLKEATGPEKKEAALKAASEFYDTVIVNVTLPILPFFLQPLFSRYGKRIFMWLAGATIDALVMIYKQIGIFKGKLT